MSSCKYKRDLVKFLDTEKSRKEKKILADKAITAASLNQVKEAEKIPSATISPEHQNKELDEEKTMDEVNAHEPQMKR